MTDKVIIFDTTLRDGEQSPGASLNIREKVKIAHQLAKLGVDVIEAGFPITSTGDYEAVQEICRQVKGPVIAGLARARKEDIERAGEAIAPAERSRIHTFIATSDIHLRHKLNKSRDEVLQAASDAVCLARNFTDDVEFSAEDATRSDKEYLCRVVEAAIKAGATTINIPDTVGYTTPYEFAKLIDTIKNSVPNIDKAILSIHCHNDLGLAVSNSLAAVKSGARQVECTINGLGERAGNASLEEVVMTLATRKDFFGLETSINTQEIYQASRMVSSLTGIHVQWNKAIVGKNAFAHEAGIHQDGVLKEKATYEIMTPESIGLSTNRLVLGKHSGRHALKDRLNSLGFSLEDKEIDRVFKIFKDLADKKKEIFDDDLIAIVEDEIYSRVPETWTLQSVHVSCGSNESPQADVQLSKGEDVYQESATGDGPVDAICKAICKIVDMEPKMTDFSVTAVTGGKDAVGEVCLKIDIDNRIMVGKSASTDIIVSSAKAYLQAINRALYFAKN
jgi:2-isopropylmalate synthase